MASAINALYGNNSTTSNSSSSATSLGGAPSEEVFLQLLVSQIQNQDPLNPTDSTTFVSQLAQFSELEQVIAIRGDTDALATAAQNSTHASGTGSSNSSSNSTSGSNQTSGNNQTSNSSGTNSTGQTQS